MLQMVRTRSSGPEKQAPRRSKGNVHPETIDRAIARHQGLDVEDGKKLRVYKQVADNTVDGVHL
jgi:hypothetical protein